ncbi:hypothetical protein DOTSEDRAFT_70801 [Dothistroma septosporum NZE10]|uniref:DnaJ homologue subfamily C member 28 conserved domain-containing protein n=1 Tax=Dothistroma septosporum (strain NZE10 / CBS 128990) TaxID=675120 RepID=N1PR75_DOTSN|nr:hypothetical protein DOTSEDRAFT_70801 [Dothistroma septosporum NZE10]
MPGINHRAALSVCARCQRARSQALSLPPRFRHASDAAPRSPPSGKEDDAPHQPADKPAPGAMSRRLQEMGDENLESGGRSARNAVAEAGFNEDLKRELENKIASASFRSENAAAFAQANMPASAGQGTRDIAAAKHWTGTESVEDASLRMLDDSHRRIRTPAKLPSIRGPAKVDTGRSRSKAGAGTRLANARDRSSAYSYVNDQEGLSKGEREAFRKEMQQRFQPAARHVPASVQGLNSLANQRIEDAIARGQFKNLPNQGKPMERDYNADSPFINTTEYFMNKIIKKQEITPPWIEKQQEVVSTANTFRRRLRSDWRRHVSRVIASKGGSLESQTRLAEEYAFAETMHNPSKQQIEKLNAIDGHGHMSQITIAGTLSAAPADDATIIDEEIKIMEQTFNDDGTLKPAEERVKVSTEVPLITQQPPPESPRRVTVAPFRDPHWEQIEKSYQTLAIKQLNDLTRSYNLMAPNLAKKPYFSLERELRNCYADVAPQVAAAIRERALAPKVKGVEVVAHRPGSVLEKFSVDRASHVYDERKPQYGFKQFWRDLFAPRS